MDDAANRASTARRARALVDQYLDFVWRSLRRLGVHEADCDDGCQRVWMVLVRKLDQIEAGKERSYLFSITVRVASEMRRRNPARRDAALSAEWQDDRNSPEEELERREAQRLLGEILEGLPWELRTVFILFELEGMATPDIAETLELPRGTVASRLRRARELFSEATSRIERRGARPPQSSGVIAIPVKGALG